MLATLDHETGLRSHILMSNDLKCQRKAESALRLCRFIHSGEDAIPMTSCRSIFSVSHVDFEFSKFLV
jgi:hypothetical protein